MSSGSLLAHFRARLVDFRDGWQLPPAARAARKRDRAGLSASDPGSDAVIDACLSWLCLAQDRSRTQDGGVARDYSLIDGWASSYPETTGYIVPTLLRCAEREGFADLRERARRMLDWLARIQLPGGGFQGGKVDATPVVPVTFNTGQILFALASGVEWFSAYVEPLRRAADWLVATQDSDGCWRKSPTPFAAPGEKAYETHVAWGLLEAAKVEPGRGYAEAALANIDWALTHQTENGWWDRCCLTDPDQPLTHTLGYALRGVIEGYGCSGREDLLAAACLTADGLLGALRDDGFLPGRLRRDWSPAVDWACLTGSAQVAACWLLLYLYTGNRRYRDGALAANRFVRCTVQVDGEPNFRGAVRGSFPIDGAYGKYQYLNWAVKFLIDSLLLEQRVHREEHAE